MHYLIEKYATGDDYHIDLNVTNHGSTIKISMSRLAAIELYTSFASVLFCKGEKAAEGNTDEVN